jgi:hypothetical protein
MPSICFAAATVGHTVCQLHRCHSAGTLWYQPPAVKLCLAGAQTSCSPAAHELLLSCLLLCLSCRLIELALANAYSSCASTPRVSARSQSSLTLQLERSKDLPWTPSRRWWLICTCQSCRSKAAGARWLQITRRSSWQVRLSQQQLWRTDGLCYTRQVAPQQLACPVWQEHTAARPALVLHTEQLLFTGLLCVTVTWHGAMYLC